MTPRKVTVGLAGNDDTEIIDGLKEGERVVTAIVQPKKASAPTTSGAARWRRRPRRRHAHALTDNSEDKYDD